MAFFFFLSIHLLIFSYYFLDCFGGDLLQACGFGGLDFVLFLVFCSGMISHEQRKLYTVKQFLDFLFGALIEETDSKPPPPGLDFGGFGRLWLM